jgi:hypothetical protein
MNEIREIRQALEDIRYERIVVRADLAFRKFIQAVKAGFNENQHRDERGRWTAEGGVEVTTYDGFLTGYQRSTIRRRR